MSLNGKYIGVKMNSFQIVMLSLAAALGVSAFGSPLWTYLKNVSPIGNKRRSTLDRLEPKSQPSSPSLVEVVKEWEELRTVCKKAQLNKAVEQLDAIFPLLNSGDKNV